MKTLVPILVVACTKAPERDTPPPTPAPVPTDAALLAAKIDREWPRQTEAEITAFPIGGPYKHLAEACLELKRPSCDAHEGSIDRAWPFASKARVSTSGDAPAADVPPSPSQPRFHEALLTKAGWFVTPWIDRERAYDFDEYRVIGDYVVIDYLAVSLGPTHSGTYEHRVAVCKWLESTVECTPLITTGRATWTATEAPKISFRGNPVLTGKQPKPGSTEGMFRDVAIGEVINGTATASLDCDVTFADGMLQIVPAQPKQTRRRERWRPPHDAKATAACTSLPYSGERKIRFSR